jgi:CheY-like chemotaxis protein
MSRFGYKGLVRTKILVLDDDQNRLDSFVKNFSGSAVECTKTPEKCIKLLSEQTFDQLFLDHDLYGKAWCTSGPGTGYQVALWLRDHSDRKPPKIVLHSYNDWGRLKQKKLLPEAEESPFPPWLSNRGVGLIKFTRQYIIENVELAMLASSPVLCREQLNWRFGGNFCLCEIDNREQLVEDIIHVFKIHGQFQE